MRVRDEVWGMTIEEDEAAGTSMLEGRTYHFCTERCRRKFREHPDWYVETEGNRERGPGQN